MRMSSEYVKLKGLKKGLWHINGGMIFISACVYTLKTLTVLLSLHCISGLLNYFSHVILYSSIKNHLCCPNPKTKKKCNSSVLHSDRTLITHGFMFVLFFILRRGY